MKVALYARVSMDEMGTQREQEPENQLIPLRQYAQSMGYEVYKEYVDRASGANPNRPSFVQLLKDASQHQFSKILVWKMDRLTRESPSKVLSLLEKLKGYHVALKSFTESWADTSEDSPIGELLFPIFAWVAAEERRKISERTKAAIARQKALGVYKGGRPFKTKAPPLHAGEEAKPE